MRIYGLLDLGFAALYAWIGFVVAPGRSLLFNLALAIVSGMLATAGVGLLIGARWGRIAGVAASALLLVFTVVTVALLVAASAYLHGVYGALGQGIAIVSACVAALVVEGFGLLPLFQLRFLLREGGAGR